MNSTTFLSEILFSNPKQTIIRLNDNKDIFQTPEAYVLKNALKRAYGKKVSNKLTYSKLQQVIVILTNMDESPADYMVDCLKWSLSMRYNQFRVISAFPATGKSTLWLSNEDDSIEDMDSSDYSKEDFPTNYLDDIKRCKMEQRANKVLISTHADVRKGILDNPKYKGLKRDYLIVYPDISLKDEYMQRFKDRDDSKEFIDFMNKNWDAFIKDIEKSPKHCLWKLKEGQYLSDIKNLILYGLL